MNLLSPVRFRRAAFLASLFVLLPAALLIVVGVLVLVFQRESFDIAFGVLILCFCALLAGGAVWLVVTLRRSADLSRLQADFLSKVSHDFRTPLTSIRMFVETLREDRLQDPVRRERVLSLLGQETERLSLLIDRLLDFARMEAGKLQLKARTMDLAEVVHAVTGRFEARLTEPRVVLEIDVQPDVAPVHVDPDAMGEVLQNLLDNAFKYTGDDKRIVVQLAMEGREVALRVRDNGPGIARKDHRRIFEQFARLDDRLARATEGSGLGLAICTHIVTAHRGKIRVESEPGQGALFVVTLPAAPPPEPAADRAEAGAAG